MWISLKSIVVLSPFKYVICNVIMKWHEYLGILAGLFIIAGTLFYPGSLEQRLLFLLGAPLLAVTAYVDRQKMFTALQGVVTTGAIIAFFDISVLWRYAILLSVALLSIVYLIKTDYYNTDKYGWIGTIGLLCFAMAFAAGGSIHPAIFSSLLIVGGLSLTIYSIFNFVVYKTRIALIWVFLNLVLIITPVITLFRVLTR